MNNPVQSNNASTPPKNTKAIVSLVSGIISLVFLVLALTWVGFLIFGSAGAAIVALVTGHKARTRIRKSLGTKKGNGLAVAGLMLGYATGVITCLILFIRLLLLNP